MTNRIPRKIRILLAAEILILLMIIALIIFRQTNYFSADLTPTGHGTADLVYNDLSLEPGSYSLIIDYKADNDIYFSISGSNGNSENRDVYIRGRYGFLRYHKDEEVIRFRTRSRLNSLSINPASTEGLEISSIRIVSNCDDHIRTLVILTGVFLFIDFMIWFLLYRNKKTAKETLPEIITLTAITITASLPLFIPGIVRGYDFATHLMRIESIYHDLASGAFPVRINSIYLRNFSYPFSVYYGDILLYPAALLRMAHFDITETWKIYFFAVNAITALITYSCTHKMFRDRWLSLVLSCAYTTAPYRLANLYERGAVGEFSAMTIYPVIALTVYRIYTQDLTKEKSRKYSNLIALAMSLLVCTHLLSTEMTVFTLFIIAVILFKKTFSKKVFFTLASAALKTLLLSLFFIVPFLDYYISTPTIISDIVSNKAPEIQEYGVTLKDFFSLPLSQYACYSSPGIIFTAVLIIGIILLAAGRSKLKESDRHFLFIIVPISLILSIMSTRYFPWNFLGLHTRFGQIAGQIQFPFRFIGILSILLMLVLGILLSYPDVKYAVLIRYGIFAVSAVTSILILLVSINEVKTTTPTNTSELDSETVGSGEYVLSGSNVWYREINDTLLSDANTGIVTDCVPNGTGLIMQCKTSGSPGEILIPKYNYKGYRVFDKDGNRLPSMDGANKLIACTLPADYTGPIYVRFVEPRYWRLAELVSLISLLALILSLNKRRKNQ